jgi:uncharacterized damage-inducible protein DinB
MQISNALLPEFDHEMAVTRKCLERHPEDRSDWKPHEKSMSMAQLATHLANIPHWCVEAISKESANLAPAAGAPPKQEPLTSRKDLLERFDNNVAAARAAISGCSDADFMQPWTLLAGEKTVFTLPRVAVVRAMVLSHIIHHRGQWSVYLRLNDVPVPAIYGSSADEGKV